MMAFCIVIFEDSNQFHQFNNLIFVIIQPLARMRILRHEIWEPTFEKKSQTPSCRDIVFTAG
jgi:hypothetical protein